MQKNDDLNYENGKAEKDRVLKMELEAGAIFTNAPILMKNVTPEYRCLLSPSTGFRVSPHVLAQCFKHYDIVVFMGISDQFLQLFDQW